MTRTGQTPWWSSIKRNLISVVPRRWPQLFLKCRAPSAADRFSRRSREISAAGSGTECGADAGIGRSADPASRPWQDGQCQQAAEIDKTKEEAEETHGSTRAAASTTLKVEASNGLPGFRRADLLRYLASQMADR